MKTSKKSLVALTVGDVMTRDVEVIPQAMTLRAAAQFLRREQISGVPVVDDHGRCVGVLSAADFLRPAEAGGGKSPRAGQARTCSFQEDVVRADGKEAVRCTLAEGACVLQSRGTLRGGKVALLCQMPYAVVTDWQQLIEERPTDAVGQYMTRDVVTAQPATKLPVLARMMVDAHIHRVIVTDEAGCPVGIVTSTDVLAAVASLAGEGR